MQGFLHIESVECSFLGFLCFLPKVSSLIKLNTIEVFQADSFGGPKIEEIMQTRFLYDFSIFVEQRELVSIHYRNM